MCAMDRSQIMVYSQSEIINHLEDLLSISSSQSFVRDAQGELIYLSPPFERTVLNGNELNIWFSSIPVNVRLDLFNAELNSLSGMGPFVFKNVKSIGCLLTILIECISVNNVKFVRWVFFLESTNFLSLGDEYFRASVEIDDIFCMRKKVDLDFWKVFNLYAYGFTISKICGSTKLTEDKVKKLIRKIKTDCFVSDRDYLGLLVLNTFNYCQLAFNVIKILSGNC